MNAVLPCWPLTPSPHPFWHPNALKTWMRVCMTRLWTVMSSIPLAAASASPSFTPVLTFGRREEDSRIENQDLNFTYWFLNSTFLSWPVVARREGISRVEDEDWIFIYWFLNSTFLSWLWVGAREGDSRMEDQTLNFLWMGEHSQEEREISKHAWWSLHSAIAKL